MSCAQHKAEHKNEYSCVAQLAERSTVNRMVAGSSPAAGANNHRLCAVVFCYKIFSSSKLENMISLS